MTFATYEQADDYVKKHGRDWTRPCDKLKIMQDARKQWEILIYYKASGELIGRVTEE